MASNNRTEGPWRLQPMGNGYRVLGGPRQRRVASVPARRLADGQLIVAAPDLLAVCERILRKDGIASLRGELAAAIAKAKGEADG